MLAIRIGCLLAVTSLLGSGCLLPQVPPSELPDELKAVMANRESVAVPPDDPMFDVPAGTTIDALEGLDGCWARYYVEVAGPDQFPMLPPGTPFFDEYDFFRFDFDSGEMTHIEHGEFRVGSYGGYILLTGTFQIEGNHLTFTSTSGTYPDPLAGGMSTAVEDYTYDYLVTLDGNTVTLVRLYVNENGDVVPSDEDVFVCVRFDCPE